MFIIACSFFFKRRKGEIAMDSKDLSYFCSVYQYKNISKAAKACYITPQGMSKVIQKLEAELGVVLFTRSNQGLCPTVYGDTLFENVKGLTSILDNIKDEIIDLGKEKTRDLDVAMTLGVIDYLSADFILEYKKMYPEIRLNMVMNSNLRMKELVENDKAQVGIIMGPIDVIAFDGIAFTSHNHCVMIHKSHPLAQKDVITYKDLDGEPLAIVCREFSAYQNVMNRFLAAGVKPNIVFEVGEIETVHTFAQENRGIAFTVDFCAFAHQRAETVIRPLEDKSCLLESFLITKKGRILSPDAKQFIDYALEWVKKMKSTKPVGA